MAKVRSFRLASRQDIEESANVEPPKPPPPTMLERSDEALAYIASLPPIFAHAKDESSSMRRRDGAE